MKSVVKKIGFKMGGLLALAVSLANPAFSRAAAAVSPEAQPVQAAQDSRVEELEQQLRSTQDYMFTEFAKLSKGEGEKGGKGKESFPVTASLKDVRLRLLIRSKYSYVEEGIGPTGKRVAPVSSFGLSNVRLYLDGDVGSSAGYVFKAEFASKGADVQVQEAYGTYDILKDKVVLALGQRQPKTTGNGPAEYWPFVSPVNSSDTMRWSNNDRGLGISGRVLNDKFFYEGQVMNGNGIDTSATGNDNYKFLYSMLTRYEPNGKISPSQNDIKFSEFLPGFSLVAARSRDAKSGAYRQDKVWYSGAYYMKWKGLYAKAFFASQDVKKEAGAAKDQYLWSVHTGYCIRAWAGDIVEPIARYEQIDYNRGAVRTMEKRAAVGFNYYLEGDKARLTMSYTIKREKGKPSIDNDTFEAGYSIFF